MKYNNSKFLLIGLVVISLLICLGSISATNNTNTDTNTQNINIDDNNIQDNHEIQQTTKKTQNSETLKKENKNKKTTTQTNYEVNNYNELYNKIENEIKKSNNTEAIITLKPGNYNITNTINWGNTTHTTKILTIKGQGQTLDGQGKYQFITIIKGYTLNLENITIQKCEAGNGAVINSNGTVTIKDSNFNENEATRGGVNYNYRSDMTIINCNFTQNNATKVGGVNYNDKGNMTIINSIFTKNNAMFDGEGGVNYNYDGDMNITNSNFIQNTATRGGVNSNAGNMTIINCNFTQNNATSYDGEGGVNFNCENLTIINSNFIQNTAKHGGVNYNYKNTNMTIINCNFTQNNATKDGGVNYNDKSTNINISNSNFNENTATRGGVNYNYYRSDVTIINCNFTKNNATHGGVNYNYRSNMNITNSIFTKNNVTGYNGEGGVNYNNGNINITSSNFTQNTATYGGVNYNDHFGIMNITNVNFTKNKATKDGGVNYNNEGDMNITNSNFTQNTATRGGVNYNTGNINITSSNFTQNIAEYRGGVSYNYESKSNMTIINSNFNENKAIEDGGVNFIYNGDLYINNSSFLNNFDINNIIIYSNKLFIMGNSSIINILNPISTNTNSTIRSPLFITSLDKNEKIEFTFNNKTQITTKNTTNNYVQITDSFENMGKLTVTIKYPSFNDNNTIKLEIPLEKGVQDSKLENKTINILENYTVNLIVNDTQGNPIVGNLSCAVKINGVTQLHTKTENEKLTFILNTEKFSAKTYNITIVIGGNSIYNRGIITQTLVIQNRPVAMEITTNTPKTITDNLDINVKLTEDGNLINGGFVIFKINGITLKDATGQQIRVNVTDGYAKLNYTLPDTIGAGKYNLTCVYNKKYYNNTRDTINFTIEREVIPTKTIKTLENYTVNLILKDKQGNPIVGNLSCAVKINGVTQLHTKTENEKLTFTLNTEKFLAKAYNITIVIGGNSHYDKRTITQTLVIQNRPVDMKITTNTPKTTENLDVNVKLTEDGNLVDGGFVIFKINGITLKDATGQQIRANVTNGYAKLNYTLPDTMKAGKYKITCVYNKKYYNNTRDTENFIVKQ